MITLHYETTRCHFVAQEADMCDFLPPSDSWIFRDYCRLRPIELEAISLSAQEVELVQDTLCSKVRLSCRMGGHILFEREISMTVPVQKRNEICCARYRQELNGAAGF
jgi:hypothetical protein